MPLYINAEKQPDHIHRVLPDVHYIQFNLTSTVTPGEGILYWDSNDGTLDIGMPGGNVNLQIGQEILIRAKNSSGADMTNGQVVYISGSSGIRPLLTLAKADAEITSSRTIGLLTEDIVDGQQGYLTTFGLVRNVNTDPGVFTDGDLLWLSASNAGAYTNVMPSSPNHAVKIGYVIKAHLTEGIIFVCIQNGWELYELHDVADSLSAPTAGEFLAWDSSTSLWNQTSDFVYDFATGKLTHTGDFSGGVNSLATFTTTVSSNSNNLSTVTASSTSSGYIGSNLTGFNSSISAPTGNGHTLTGLRASVSHTAIGASTIYGLRITTDSRAGDNVWGVHIADSGSVAAKNYFGDGFSGFRNSSPEHMLDVIINAAAVHGLKVKANAGQTANIIEVQNSSSVTIFNVESDGEVVIPQDNKAYKAGATDTDIQMYSDGTDGVISVTGGLRLGSGATNYTDIQPDGEIQLVGTARVKLEEAIFAISSEKGASAPTETTVQIGTSATMLEGVLTFSSIVQNDAYFTYHVPGDTDGTVPIQFHLMWKPGAAWTAGNYVWKLEYIVKNEGDDATTGASTTISVDVTPANATDFIESEFVSTISATAQQTISCHFYRDVANDNGDAVGVVRFYEFERTINKLGEAT